MKEITQLQIVLAVAIVCIIALSAIGLIENNRANDYRQATNDSLILGIAAYKHFKMGEISRDSLEVVEKWFTEKYEDKIFK